MFNKQKLFAFSAITIFVLSLILTQPVFASSALGFNKDLQAGMANTEVKELQKFLNNNGFVLSQAGPGSKNNETSFFGPITRNALIKFQKANNIVPAVGYFGPITRAVVNKIVKLSVANPADSQNLIKPATQTSPIQSENLTNNNQSTKQTNNLNDQSIKNDYYAIGGSITGIVDVVILQNNAKDDLTININQDSNFTFPAKITNGSNYNITVKSEYSGQTCYISNGTGVVSGADIKNVKIACGVNLSYNPLTYIPSSGRIISYSLLYTAGAGGTISGAVSQTVNSGRDGSTVTAVPDAGYSFVGWSDGVLTAERTDYSITSNKSVTANFEINIVAPSDLSYISPNLFVTNTTISTLTPTVTGTVDSYSISPDLPVGLSLNTSNGQLTGTPTASTTESTYIVTATNAGGSTTFEITIMVYGTVIGGNGKIWLDRNLGATQVATSSTDYLAYGGLFQWGRADDGHQLRNSSATSTNSSSDTPGHDNFILEPNSPFDWLSSQNDNLWQGVNAINNPCPIGFRLPTETEWEAERTSWDSNNSSGAFTSPLKLTLAGVREYNNGSLVSVDSYGVYWSSVVVGALSRTLIFNSGAANMSTNYRAKGYSIRCTANSYSVSYNDNGSTGGTTPTNQTKIHDTTLVLATNSGDLAKTDYTFAGWNTTTDGTGTDYAVGANYTSNASITLYAKWTPVPAVGASYQGGKIAYIFQEGDAGYVAGETHGIIAATADQGTNILWAKPANISISVGDTLVTIGSGSANTDKIIAQNSLDSTYAAGLARSYSGGGYTDWYLPSRDELNKLYLQKTAIGGFVDSWYFSSSEFSSSNAWLQNLGTGSQANAFKSLPDIYVRAVRSF